MTRKILFVDRDGTIIEEPADHQVDSYEKFRLLPGVIPAMLRFARAGYAFVMVTNQDRLGEPGYPQEAFDRIQTLLLGVLETQGIAFEAIRVCPHDEARRCLCRKPAVGLVQDYLANPDWDRELSYFIGDRATDLTMAVNMGIHGIRVGADHGWRRIADDVLTLPRRGSAFRKTKETEIRVAVNLDGSGASQISTGIGFFDHMLEQISKHGGFDLDVSVAGDTHVDDHHTVEDTALALGSALRSALGDKNGIERFGFVLPMDDASAQVAIDLSGRAFCKFEGTFDREFVGAMATEMVPHFYRSLAEGLQANIHVRVEGDNTHHRVESSFKAVGRCLRIAIAQTGKAGVPSTKGAL